MARITEGVIALKIASRSIKRNRLQSFLIIAIIAVPVILMSALVTFDASTKSTSAELVRYELGDAKAKFEVVGTPNDNQAQTPTSMYLQYITQDGNPANNSPADIHEVLPGLDLLTINKTELVFKTAAGVGPVSVFAGQIWNKALLNKGPVSLLSGTIPKSENQVLVTPSALKRFGVKVGQEIATDAGNTFRVVGTLRDYSTSSSADIVFMPESALPNSNSSNKTYYQLQGEGPTWEEILQINKQGIGVLSREVILNPPPKEDQPLQGNSSGVPFIAIFSVLLFLVPLGLLPVVVLAGSAFAFGARRQTKTLAVMSSLGASRKTLQNVTITSGIWLGLLGGLVGVCGGVIFIAFFGPSLTTRSFIIDPSWNLYPGFHIPWVYLAGLVLASGFLGAISSYLPARKASRVNIMATMRGQREQGKVMKRTAVGALFLLLIGVALVALSAILFVYAQNLPAKAMSEYEAKDSLMRIAVYGQLAGGMITVVGFMVGRGWILRGIMAVLSRMGKLFNFAGRDLLFNRSRYAPVISSVLVVYFVGAMILGVSYGPMIKQANDMAKMQTYLPGQYDYEFPRNNSNQEKTPDEYLASLPDSRSAEYSKNTIVQSGAFTNVSVISSTPDYYSRAARDAEGNFVPAFDVTLPHVIFNPEEVCHYQSLSGKQQEYSKAHQKDQNSEDYYNYPKGCINVTDLNRTIVVGDVNVLRVIANRADAKAEDTLIAGGVVVLSRLYDFHGTAKIRWTKESEYTMENAFSSKNASQSEDLKSYLVPGIDSPNIRFSAIISPKTAERLGIIAYPQNVLANSAQPISSEVSDSLMGKGIYFNSYSTQAGPDADSFGWMITFAAGAFALLATSIALGLSQIEATADKRTLAAVGAPRSFRARMVAAQAFALTLTGSLLGGGVGLAVGLSLVISAKLSDLVLPLNQLVTLFVGVPILSALIFWVFTPRRLNFENRQALD
jgi:ABC-type antimicrobial peptide transport system permease subunit